MDYEEMPLKENSDIENNKKENNIKDNYKNDYNCCTILLICLVCIILITISICMCERNLPDYQRMCS